MVSRRHCIIQYNFKTKRFLCIDQKSLNGTFVNHERVGSREIADGDYLVFTGGSSYEIGETLPLSPLSSGSGSSGSGSMGKLSSSVGVTNGKQSSSSSSSSIRGSSNASSSSSSSGNMSKEAIQSALCLIPNTFIYRFNILEHPNEMTPTPCTLSLTPKLHPTTATTNTTTSTAGEASGASTTSTAITKKRDRKTIAHDIDINHAMSDDEDDEDDDENMQSPIKKQKQPDTATAAPTSTTDANSSASKSVVSDVPLTLEQENALMKQRIEQLEMELRATREQNIQIQNMSGHANTVLMSILESEFHCSICQTLLLQPTTLQCSHTFCTSCIQQWLPTHRSCPICRKQITKQPIRNISLQGVLEKLEMLLSEDDKEERVAREAEIKKKEDDDLQKLNALVKNARDSGAQFLKIEDEWSERDKRAFVAGLTKYSGIKARQVYLSLTGFSLESIAKLAGNSLLRVCKNIGVTPVYLTGAMYDRRQILDAESTREKLREFCRNDTISIVGSEM